MPRGSRPRFCFSGAAPAPVPRVPRGTSDFATQRGLPPQREGHTHLRWACPEAVGRASVSPGPLRLRFLASREEPPTSRPSAASRRNGGAHPPPVGMPRGSRPRFCFSGAAPAPVPRVPRGTSDFATQRGLPPQRRGTPTAGGHAPRQSAALLFLRGRSGSGSSRPARNLRLRDPARPPAATEGHTHRRWACPEAVGRASVSPGPLRLRFLASREEPPTSRPSAASRAA